jgi:hypothetical protein
LGVALNGLQIEAVDAGDDAPAVIDAGLDNSSSLAEGGVFRQSLLAASNPDGVAAVRGVVENPTGFAVNLKTDIGFFRGVLEPAESTVLLGALAPAEGLTGTGVIAVTAIRSASGGHLFLSATAEPSQKPVSLNALEIREGSAGGPVALRAGAFGLSGFGGAQTIQRDLPAPGGLVNALFDNPSGYFVVAIAGEFPQGAYSAQLARAESTAFSVQMKPTGNVPTLGDGAGQTYDRVSVYTLRRDGALAAAHVVYDVNPRFNDTVQFLGLHLHRDAADVTLSSSPLLIDAFHIPGGFGNIYRATNASGAALERLNSLLANPAGHYVDLEGIASGRIVSALRAQLQ